MTDELNFVLETPISPLTLDATLPDAKAGRPRIMNARDVVASKRDVTSFAFNADFDGDGTLDRFILNISTGQFSQMMFTCNKRASTCSLFAPANYGFVKKLIPADINGDGLADLYLEFFSGGAYVLFNHTKKVSSPIDKENIRQNYEQHLKDVNTAVKENFEEVKLKAVRHGVGMNWSHTWVMPKLSDTPFTWLDGKPPYTDCVFDLERTLAEIFSPSGSFAAFSDTFRKVQYYENKGPERTDFFTTEAVPHLVKLRMITNETERLFKIAAGKSEIPSVTGTIDKEMWSKNTHEGKSTGKDIEPKNYSLKYIPFQQFLEYDFIRGVAINSKIAEVLPEVSFFVVINKNRKIAGTDIPDSHIAYLIKNNSGEFDVLHSTPLTDMGLATKTYETVSKFFGTRYTTSSGEIVNKDKTAVGLQIFFIGKK